MPDVNRAALEQLVRRVLLEKLAGRPPKVFGVKKSQVPQVQVTETDRLDTGNPADIVYTHDLFTLSESPRLGAGLMVMEHTTFPWSLTYDEMDYVIEGHLDVFIDDGMVSAGPGEIIFIPKGSKIKFSAPGRVRFLYFVYPADWQNQSP